MKISPTAKEDLKSIFEYIALTLNSPIAADNQLKRIEKVILNLNIFPLRYSLYEDKRWENEGLRFFPIDNYVVFYVCRISIKEVMIIRIFYSRRNEEINLNTNMIPKS